jgi:beta-galactosidase
VYYLYQANWSEKPVLHIATRDWLRRAGEVVEQPVQVYSNAEEVELFLDGQSLGLKKPDDVKNALWQVPFRDGSNFIEARGKRTDKVLRDAVRVQFKRYPTNLSDPATPFEEIAMLAGANVSYTDPQGLTWLPAKEYKPGGWGYVGGVDQWKAIKGEGRADILGTTEDPLYHAVREGIEALRFDVPAGEYELELRFAEYFPKKPGERVFRVTCNGQTLIDKLDLAATYGVRRAASRAFLVKATGAQGLNVGFEATTAKTIVSGVRVRRTR